MSTDIVKLKHAFSFNNENFTEFNIRRIKVRDLRNLPKDELEAALTIISRVTDQPLPVIEKVDIEDFMVLSEIVKNLQGLSPQIGTGVVVG